MQMNVMTSKHHNSVPTQRPDSLLHLMAPSPHAGLLKAADILKD